MQKNKQFKEYMQDNEEGVVKHNQLYQQIKKDVICNIQGDDQIKFEYTIMELHQKRQYWDLIQYALKQQQLMRYEQMKICGKLFERGEAVLCNDKKGYIFGGYIEDIYQIGQKPWSVTVFIYVRILINANLLPKDDLLYKVDLTQNEIYNNLDLQELIYTNNYLLVKPQDICNKISVYDYYNFSQLLDKEKYNGKNYFMRYKLIDNRELHKLVEKYSNKCDKCTKMMNITNKPLICDCWCSFLCPICIKEMSNQKKNNQEIQAQMNVEWKCKRCEQRGNNKGKLWPNYQERD